MADYENKKCMIIGAVPILSRAVFEEFDPNEYYVICADGGIDNAARFSVKPDLVIGDFDSAKSVPPEEVRTLRLPVEKDETDTMSAVLVGLRLGMESFVLLGCLGGERFDHSIANLNVLLYLANRGKKAVLADEDTKVFVVRDGRIAFTELKGSTVSVFPFDGSSCNLTYSGLQYPLVQRNLTAGATLMGVSNTIVTDRAEIRVNIGCAVIVLYTPPKKGR